MKIGRFHFIAFHCSRCRLLIFRVYNELKISPELQCKLQNKICRECYMLGDYHL